MTSRCGTWQQKKQRLKPADPSTDKQGGWHGGWHADGRHFGLSRRLRCRTFLIVYPLGGMWKSNVLPEGSRAVGLCFFC